MSSNFPSRKAKNALKRIEAAAEEQYAGDLSKQEGAKQHARRIVNAITREDYVDPSVGFDQLESGLRDRFPEVWENGGEDAVEKFRNG